MTRLGPQAWVPLMLVVFALGVLGGVYVMATYTRTDFRQAVSLGWCGRIAHEADHTIGDPDTDEWIRGCAERMFRGME